MSFKNPEPASYLALTPVKKKAARRRLELEENARLFARLDVHSQAVALLTDTQAAAELGQRLNGADL